MSIDEETLSRAERKATTLATSVSEVLVEYLRQWAEKDAIQQARAAMAERFANPDWQFAVGAPDDREHGMPAPDSFLDTNILLYAISTEPSEAAKAAAAQQLLATANWAWSAQVAAEFINASTSPRRPVPLSLVEAEHWIDVWLAFPLAAIDGLMVKEAVRLAQRYQISYFDAQVIAAAKSLSCRTLYTEDLNHGQDYNGVVVTNPFVRVVP